MSLTVGEILNQYKREIIDCSRGRGGCDKIVEDISERVVEIHQVIPPGLWFWILIIAGICLVVFLLFGIRIVRPTQRGLVERFGKYRKFANPGFHWIIPLIDRMVFVNITEQMVDAERQEIITDDNLNASVDAQVYFKVKNDEENVKNSQYNVNDYEYQIVNLARTTLRNIIGTLTLKKANSERNSINEELLRTLAQETVSWGIDIVRTELKEIDPPKDVQETMNKVVKAENEKIAAVDYATAAETEADGKRRAEIKKAEGKRQADILEAEGKAQAFELVNKAFIDNAQILKQLEVTQASLENNSKIVIAEKGTNLQMIIGSIPTRRCEDKTNKYIS